MNYYESKCTDFNPKKKYIFVALHVQPEMSTSPRADAFVEQKMIIELLNSCAPSGVKIYVKEHPSQNSLSRSKKYYDDILSCKNAELISRKIGSKELVQNSLAVSTCVGLAGFESLFQNKPVLMFGHDFFQNAPGVFSIRTKANLEQAIKEIMKGQTFSQRDFRLFLKALEIVAVYGTIDSDYMPTSKIKNDENTNNIAERILAEYEKTQKND
jgi:capsule polysaccharide export protein KpsC/LpsZ